jgi:hypothetical protein
MHKVHITLTDQGGTQHTAEVATMHQHSELSLRLMPVFDRLDEYGLAWSANTIDDEVHLAITDCAVSVAARATREAAEMVRQAVSDG